MDFAATLRALHGLLGRRTSIEIRGPGGLDIATMRGTLTAGDDVGAFERSQDIGGPSHDRLLFTMHEHPFPEGFFLDRRTFQAAAWRTDGADLELRITLVGDLLVAVVDLDQPAD